MLEGFLEVPLHFTVEFLGGLVMAAGALLVASRPSLISGSRSNRLTASIGFGCLAAAYIIHGGAFLANQGDGADTLVVLRTLGYAFLLIAVVGGLRTEVAAPAVARFEAPLLLAPAISAVLLSLMAFLASIRQAPRALRRLALAAFLLAVSEVLIGFSPESSFIEGTVDEFTYAAHIVKALGAAALAAWLYVSVRSSIRLRFIVSFASLLVIVVLALSSALSGVLSSTVEQGELARVRAELRNISRTLERTRTAELREDVGQIANFSQVQAAVARRVELSAVASVLLPQYEDVADFIIFMTPDRRVLGSAGHGPLVRAGGERRRLPLDQNDVLRIAATRVVREIARENTPVAASLDSIGNMLVAQIAAANVADPEAPRRDRGIVAMGKFLDVGVMEQLSGPTADASVVVGGQIIATDLPSGIDASSLVPERTRARVEDLGVVAQKQVLSSEPYFSAFGSLTSPGGVPVGILVLSSDAELVTSTRESLTRVLFLVATIAGGFVVVLAWLSAGRIARPIQVLTRTAQAVREGDLSAQAKVSGNDEVGQLGETFNEMTASLHRMTRDLRHAAREEHALRARIEAIIDSMADGLVAIDKGHRILAFNREAENLTAVRSSAAVGAPIERVLDVRDAQGEPVALPIHQLSEGFVGSVFLVNKRGQRIPVAVTSAVLRGEQGETAGGVAVIRDMSREHEIERMKSEFLSNISHELRTPLTPIKGYAEILNRREVPSEKRKQFVGGILDSTVRLERIVELLVDFAAMEAGRMAPRATPINLGPMIRRLADEWRQRSPRHDFVAEVGPRLPNVLGDERLLRRSLEEIVDNAVKFSPQGGTIRLEARGASSTGNGRKRQIVELVVSDEGIGISPEDLSNIFSDFRQLDGSETRNFGGLGLGLAFVRRIVEQHDGSVDVESEPQQGTRFRIRIPAGGGRSPSDGGATEK